MAKKKSQKPIPVYLKLPEKEEKLFKVLLILMILIPLTSGLLMAIKDKNLQSDNSYQQQNNNQYLDKAYGFSFEYPKDLEQYLTESSQPQGSTAIKIVRIAGGG